MTNLACICLHCHVGRIEASLAGKGFTVESSDKIIVYQSTFSSSGFTSHFDEKDIMRYMCKLDRLDITDPYHAQGVFFTTIATADRCHSTLSVTD